MSMTVKKFSDFIFEKEEKEEKKAPEAPKEEKKEEKKEDKKEEKKEKKEDTEIDPTHMTLTQALDELKTYIKKEKDTMHHKDKHMFERMEKMLAAHIKENKLKGRID
jgi:methylthioribose-1-phosphate isomerase